MLAMKVVSSVKILSISGGWRDTMIAVHPFHLYEIILTNASFRVKQQCYPP